MVMDDVGPDVVPSVSTIRARFSDRRDNAIGLSRVLRRLLRDTSERGRTMVSVVEQYLNVVRPMHLQFVAPSKRYAHIIIPEGGHNKVAIDLIAGKIHSIIAERNRLRALDRELQQAKTYLENVINNMGEALLLLEPSGKIKSANPAAYRMLGYGSGELLSMSIGDVFEEEEQEQANAFFGTWLEALIRTGSLSSIAARFIASDGKRVPILFSRTAMTDTQGTITDILCIAKDMTGYRPDEENNA